MKKRVTIHDIAREADVSSATVSRVLSSSTYHVSEKLRNKIIQLAEDMNYIPNLIGKQLKTDRNMTIGVIIPSISNPFYASVLLGVEEIARKSGYQVLLCNSLQDGSLESGYLQTLFENRVQGVILSSISGNMQLMNHLVQMGLQLVTIDQKLELPNVLQIEFDYRKGGYLAAQHLLEQGHRRIGYVTAPFDRPSRISIFQGFMEAISDSGDSFPEQYLQVSPEEKNLYDGIFEFDNGRLLTRKLVELSEPPTAIFACNDLTAFGVINELNARGLRVPEDVSVMGFDNIEYSQMITPSLTTIKQPDYEMGKLACEVLLKKLENQDIQPTQFILQPTLIERNSVRKLSRI